MHSQLKFFNYQSNTPASCGEVLDIEFSSRSLDWPGVILEKGSSPHFYPDNVYTPYFYFAVALDEDLHWQVATGEGLTALKSSPGDIWINPPKTPFTHEISEPCYFIILAIEEQAFLESSTLQLAGRELQFLNNYNVYDESIKGIIDLFMIEARSGGRNGYAYLKNLLSLLSTHYIQHYSNYADLQHARTQLSRFGQAEIDRLDGYIDQHIGDGITVDDLADLLGCSKFYFLREFKKRMDITPYQYLMSKRLDRSRVLLALPGNSIASVGLALGFNDQAHFTRAFKNQFGVTPGQYQKNSQD